MLYIKQKGTKWWEKKESERLGSKSSCLILDRPLNSKAQLSNLCKEDNWTYLAGLL